MRVATVQSRCECQATLGADLDEHRHVVGAWARDPKLRVREVAPAHSIDAEAPRFQVAWHCPICTRNTLRSFDAAGVTYRAVGGASDAPA